MCNTSWPGLGGSAFAHLANWAANTPRRGSAVRPTPLRSMRSPVATVGLPTASVTSILLIRHGDRYDYAIGKEPWKLRCKASDTLVSSDPPLSALGHSQAGALASYLGSTGRRVDRILCSPYLRALQTAQPLAHASGLPLLVDFAAAEAHQMPSALPPIDARLPYFPEIDEGHVPHMWSVVTDGARGKEP